MASIVGVTDGGGRCRRGEGAWRGVKWSAVHGWVATRGDGEKAGERKQKTRRSQQTSEPHIACSILPALLLPAVIPELGSRRWGPRGSEEAHVCQ